MKLLLQLRETLDLIASLFRREFELWFQFDAAQNRFFVTGGEPRRLRPVVARFGWFPQDRFGRLPRLALLLLSRRTRVLLDGLDGLDHFDLDPATDRLGLLWIFAEDEIRNSGVGIGNRDELVGDDLAVATAAVVVVQMLGPEVLVQHPQFSEHLENHVKVKSSNFTHVFNNVAIDLSLVCRLRQYSWDPGALCEMMPQKAISQLFTPTAIQVLKMSWVQIPFTAKYLQLHFKL